MKNRCFLIFGGFVLAIIAVIFTSCKHGCGGEGGTSAHNQNRSHNMGLDCMNCHSGTGNGSGCFAVAGTVYGANMQTELANATVYLYTQPDSTGVLIRTIEADSNGNFYDGKMDGLPGTYYAVVIAPNGHVAKMLEPITKGGCNSCHGKTTDHIWVN